MRAPACKSDPRLAFGVKQHTCIVTCFVCGVAGVFPGVYTADAKDANGKNHRVDAMLNPTGQMRVVRAIFVCYSWSTGASGVATFSTRFSC